ncbi:MAG: tRNA lysidine(34) synthetase TilS [Lactobacillus sp.]|jgi:tRNA(Ile)-lysidine synthase|nr:tRNA lysidine(34) synthetase TilS [Lactobacillus sp.]
MLQTKFNKKMEELLKLHQVNDDAFVVAVSGGADSLALAFLLNNWAKKNKKIIALTVDHKLRVESADEATMVGKMMKKAGVEHHVLTWEGKKPKSGMEEAAREARYKLIAKWCKENGIKTVMIAHHKLDQAETFLMRLQRGSGVDGLSGISEFSSLLGMNILRPLLDVCPDELKAFLTQNKIKWAEDPHNVCDDYLRVRVRKILPLLEDKIGLTADRIVDTQKVLARTKDYLSEQTAKFVKNHVKLWGGCGVSFSAANFNSQHIEMRYRVFAKLVKEIGDNGYVSRASSIDKLLEIIAGKAFKGATLGGCEIILFKGKIFIIKELKSAAKLSKKEWENFVAKNKKYDNVDVPYKLKMVLCLG